MDFEGTRIFKDCSGFSMVEVLIAAGILSVVSLGVMNISKMTTDHERKLQQQEVMANVVSQISSVLVDKPSCSDSLGALTMDAAARQGTTRLSVPEVNACPDGGTCSTVFTVGQDFPSSTKQLARIQSLQLGNFARLDNRNNGFAKLFVNLKAMPDGPVYEHQVIVNVRLNSGTGAIESCFSTADSAIYAMCDSLGGTINFANSSCEGLNLTGTTSAAVNSEGVMQISGNTVVNGSAKLSSKLSGMSRANLNGLDISGQFWKPINIGNPGDMIEWFRTDSLNITLANGNIRIYEDLHVKGNFCKAGICYNFNAQNCPPSGNPYYVNVIYRVRSNGTIECRQQAPFIQVVVLPPAPPLGGGRR